MENLLLKSVELKHVAKQQQRQQKKIEKPTVAMSKLQPNSMHSINSGSILLFLFSFLEDSVCVEGGDLVEETHLTAQH